MSNVECRIKEFFLFYLLKRAERIYPSKFDSAEPFDSESFNPELTTEGLVAG
jgi:hypothetical protein